MSPISGCSPMPPINSFLYKNLALPSMSGCSPCSSDGFHLWRTNNLIALYIGLFSPMIQMEMCLKLTYCPLYRAVLQLYLPQFYIRISHELPFFNRKFPEKWDNRFDQIPFEAAYLRGSLFLHLLRLRLPHFFLSYIFFAFPSIKRHLIFTRAPITPCSNSTYDSFS